MNMRKKNCLLAFFLASIAIFYAGAAVAQNNKGQIGTDQFWAEFSKGLEWLPTSKSVSASPAPSDLDVAQDSLNSSLSPLVDQAFDPDVHRIVILSHKRSIIHRKYNERWVNEKSRPSSASMAKSLTALVVGKAICNGAIANVD